MTEENKDNLRILEAVIFANSEPVSVEVLQSQLPEGTELAPLLQELKDMYADRGIDLAEIDGLWSFRTSPDLSERLKIVRHPRRKLPRAAAEVLAIIAYHQPVTRSEIESIRGVETSRGTLDILLELGWIRPGKRRETPGRPLTWNTTSDFLSHFNIASTNDLPGMDDLKAAGLLDARPVLATMQAEKDEADEVASALQDEEDFSEWLKDEVEAESAT